MRHARIGEPSGDCDGCSAWRYSPRDGVTGGKGNGGRVDDYISGDRPDEGRAGGAANTGETES